MHWTGSRRELLAAAAVAAGAWGLSAAVGTSMAATSPQAPPMPRRRLGRTEQQVGILGLGADGIVTDGTPEEAAAVIATALTAGVNVIDTGHMYGKDGKSERNIGEVTGTRQRAAIFLATKTGSRTYDGVMRQVEESLRRLRTDHIDLMQVHHVSDKDDVATFGNRSGVLTALRKLREEKVIRFIGLTGHSRTAAVAEAMRLYEWDTLMCFTNPARFSEPALRQQLPSAVKKDMGVMGMKAFGGRPAPLVGGAAGQATAVELLHYALSQPVSLVLTGVSSRRQLLENIGAARAFHPMSGAAMQALEQRVNAADKPWERP